MQTVAVTGASGYLGSYVVKLLLESGEYNVRGTVRDPNDPVKTAHLTSLPGAAERLTLHAANLTDSSPDAFIEIFTGCDGVFHTASPFFLNEPTEESLVTPALHGTSLVLQSVYKCQNTVKKLIVTSSTAAVYANFGTLGPKHTYTEADWSLTDRLRQNKSWYALGKTLAEQSVYDFVKDTEDVKFTVCTLNPTWILGPMIQPTLNTSCKKIADYAQGRPSVIPLASKTIVDVRDVALAHLRAFESPTATGRFLLLGESIMEEDCAKFVREALEKQAPTTVTSVPTVVEKEANNSTVIFGAAQPSHILFDCSKATNELGIKFHSSREMIESTVTSLVQHKLI